MGWTINTAHPQAWLALFALLGVLVVPVAVETSIGVTSVKVQIPTVIASIIVVSLVAHAASKRK